MSRTEIAFWAAALGAMVGGLASYAGSIRMLRRKARVDVLATLHYFESAMRDERYFTEIDTFIDQADMLTRHAIIAGRRDYRLAIDNYFVALEISDQLKRISSSRQSERIAAKEQLLSLHSQAMTRKGLLEFRTHAFLSGPLDRLRYRRERLAEWRKGSAHRKNAWRLWWKHWKEIDRQSK